MVYEENGFYVRSHGAGGWTVFRPSESGTHAVSDSTYPAGLDGLACAIARVLYLARGPGRGMAAEAMSMAESHMAKARSHGRKMRNALADLDAAFGL